MSKILRDNPVITWFASNSVVANILMVVIIAIGAYTAFSVRKEGFPAFAAESVTISGSIRGSTPQDVERGVAIKIEEAIESVSGIDHISSTSTDSSVTIVVDAVEGYNVGKLLDDVKVKVDAISTLPDELESLTIEENRRQNTVVWVELYGNAPEAVRKETARKVRDALLDLPSVSDVTTFGSRDYQISIEPSEEQLRFYDLTIEEVANAVSNNSVDLGGGEVLSTSGDISLRTRNQAYTKEDFENLVVRSDINGTQILVKDVATVRDEFVDQPFLNRFNGEPTTSLKVVTEGRDDIIKGVRESQELVKNYTALPEGIEIESWLDGSTNIKDRLSLLGRNGITGIALVLITLMLFLNLRLAFWVAVGIPVSIAGAMALFPIPGLDLSLNVISAFGFLVVLGIVVDDAIVIGESIFTQKQKSSKELTPIEATVKGVKKVVTPATFGVLTTVAAFLPLTQVSGRQGNIFSQIAVVVILCLIFSLIESKLILPAHLAHINLDKKPRFWFTKAWASFQGSIANGLQWVIKRIYTPIIKKVIVWRYSVFALFIGVLVVVVGLNKSGKLRFIPFPTIYRDNISVALQLEQGLSAEYLHANALHITETLEQVRKGYREKFDHDPIKNVQVSASTDNLVSIVAELTRSTERPFLETEQILQQWRSSVGPIAGARSLVFAARAGPPGGDISINLESENLTQLKIVADEIKEIITSYEGVFDVYDTFDSGKPEIIYELTPQGKAAGFTQRDLALNIRDAFFGRNMRIRRDDGSSVPFGIVAKTTFSESLASIERYDKKRVVSVEANVDRALTSSAAVLERLKKDYFPQMQAKYPDISISQSGVAEERKKSQSSLKKGMLVALFFIYILIAIPLKSYLKPLIIMSVIPFGIIGALLGHFILGIPVSILSIFGILALSGVVVNDSLVLVCQIDDLRSEGMTFRDACQQAGGDRFRAIMLTSITTFLGLAPILLEKEVQAQFLKPMATSIAFGILFATLITLILLPALLVITKEILDSIKRLYNITPRP